MYIVTKCKVILYKTGYFHSEITKEIKHMFSNTYFVKNK